MEARAINCTMWNRRNIETSPLKRGKQKTLFVTTNLARWNCCSVNIDKFETLVRDDTPGKTGKLG